MRAWLILAFCLMSFSKALLAQVCPYGAYPGRLDEPQICRPPPDDANDNVAQPAMPKARWAKTWGAVAFDKNLGSVGAVTGKLSKREAQQAAIAECHARGGKDGCKNIAHTYYNQCAIVLAGEVRGIITASAQTIDKARAIGMKSCKEENMICRDYYSACSEPIRIQ